MVEELSKKGTKEKELMDMDNSVMIAGVREVGRVGREYRRDKYNKK